MLIMTPNVDIEKATEVEMPAIVDKENDEFAVVHANPEWSNVTPTQNTPVSDCSPARLPDPFVVDVHQQVSQMTKTKKPQV